MKSQQAVTKLFMCVGAAVKASSRPTTEMQASAAVMRRFYERMLGQGLTPAAALRAAQVELSQDRRWRAPYFWAAYVLQGDWQ